ncbi:MAG: cellobiose phosphorylase [Ethanoligenens sp.]
MRLQQHTPHTIFSQGKSTFSFLPSGDIDSFTYGAFLINDYYGCAKDGSMNNIWLRVYHQNAIQSYPLLGRQSASHLARGKNRLLFTGQVDGITYEVTFYAAGDGLWLWNVMLEGIGETVDIVYGQDIGVALKNNVLTNELYMAQYLDHCILKGNNGYAVCSRQNQPQGDAFPYLQQGMIQGQAIGYSTDGMQFFGRSYKATNVPEALQGDLPNENYQFEFSYTALQSAKILLRGKQECTFYGLFKPTHPDAVRKLEFAEEVQAAFTAFQMSDCAVTPLPSRCVSDAYGAPFVSPQWSEQDIAQAFPHRKLEEREGDVLLSFFTEEHTHVVLQKKECLTERPHGHILFSGIDLQKVNSNVITSTNYMYGLFNGQTVIGNTSFHKFLSTPRGLLNNLKTSGQRLYISLNGQFRLLTLPAAYEMGIHFSRWYYMLPEDTLVVTAFSVKEQTDIVLDVRSTSGKLYAFLLTNQLILGADEFTQTVVMEETGPNRNILRFSPDPKQWVENPYPGLHYDMQFPGTPFIWNDDRIFFDDNVPQNSTLLVISIPETNGFQCIIQGRLEAEEPQEIAAYPFASESKKFYSFFDTLSRGLTLQSDGAQSEYVDKLNETLWWFHHNAMVHFATPHGLEQTGGAAWGTRDICQGPMEYFLSMRHFPLARSVLKNIYAHQFWETGDWPQWFMFDRYTDHAGECHGDVVLWPLKALGDYIAASGDSAILNEMVLYMGADGKPLPEHAESLLSHVMRAANTLSGRFLNGTHLISYAGGDWDDTLQPASDNLKEKLVSAWTQALAYQVVRQLGRFLQPTSGAYALHLLELSDKIKDAFQTTLIKDGVIAGFACREDDGSFRHMLHPSDNVTGIHYRLLPMTRSIIAEMVASAQALKNVELIDAHLSFPDGVRLMDRPARYNGGISHLFRRAEQMANVGREVSLQYTHAHIRYLEAMSKLGLGDRIWKGLLQISPVKIQESVPNAALRQSNVYFSSSDGMFPDRYSYSKYFEKLYDGTIKVKNGWRLYSSGPGIYVHQLVSNILGIRFEQDAIVIDPVLPSKLDGLRVTFHCFGQNVTFVYHITACPANNIQINRNGTLLQTTALPNPYRAGGIKITRSEFEKESGEVHITLQ